MISCTVSDVSQERFIRCPHCGLPHEASATVCPVDGQKIERKAKKRKVAPPPAGPIWKTPIPDPDAPVEDPSPSVTRLFGLVLDDKYRIDELIGKGGMGVVYRGEHQRLKKPVAIKVLLRGHQAGSVAQRRFEREARAAGSLGHPNICQTFDIGNLPDGSPYLVMELLQGRTLAQRLGVEGPFPIEEGCDVLADVLSALEAAHAGKIVHRDLKPDNVFLTEKGAKLLDFGVSKKIDENTMRVTRTGAVVGTPSYLAPEQARGDDDVDHRADLWAAGVLLYETLTGMLPFTASNYNALLVKILTRKATPPSHIRPAISPELEAVILKAMSHERDERFEDAATMRAALLDARNRPSGPAPVPSEILERTGSFRREEQVETVDD